MIYCPACGAANNDNARYCRECRTRLETQRRPREERAPASIAPAESLPGSGPGASLATISLVLGILGLGPLALLTGIIALRREPAHRGRARAGIILGIITCAAVAAFLVVRATGGDPLRRPITSEQVETFVAAAYNRLDKLESHAADVSDRIGPGAESELSPAYGAIEWVKNQLESLDEISDEEELNTAKDEILDRIQEADNYLSGR
jgi:hypothetical protein